MNRNNIEPRLRLVDPVTWSHHRGGWSSVIDHIARQYSSEHGTLFVSAIEDRLLENGPILEPWVGVAHQVPRHSLFFFDLERMVQSTEWIQSAPFCKGVWTLTDYARRYLSDRTAVSVEAISYPVETPKRLFSNEEYRQKKTLVHVGHFLRRYASFSNLVAPKHDKILLATSQVHRGLELANITLTPETKLVDYIADDEYDELLSRSVVFLHLDDAVAVTAIQECIARQTPVMVNRVGATTELLGDTYPLFYDDLTHAQKLLDDDLAIADATSYLKDRCTNVSFERFDELIADSEIYSSLPTPRSPLSSKALPTPVDVAVVVCSYGRVHLLEALLKTLVGQDFNGSYRIIVWNNNPRDREAIDAIVEGVCLGGDIECHVVHSSCNYYCGIRPSVTHLVNSRLIQICDDDVLPSRGYLQHFFDAYHRLSRHFKCQVAVCARGHRFDIPKGDPCTAMEVWERKKYLKFFDESARECEIHFAHADNLLISTQLLKQAGSIPLPDSEYTLVDDYWLSFAMSKYLGVKIWRIEASRHISFDVSADDGSVALFHNPQVHEARLHMCQYHLDQGWPNA